MYKYFFRNFPVAGKKGERIMKKKKCCCVESVGLLPNCIAKGKDFVLQYSHCIAEI